VQQRLDDLLHPFALDLTFDPLHSFAPGLIFDPSHFFCLGLIFDLFPSFGLGQTAFQEYGRCKRIVSSQSRNAYPHFQWEIEWFQKEPFNLNFFLFWASPTNRSMFSSEGLAILTPSLVSTVLPRSGSVVFFSFITLFRQPSHNGIKHLVVFPQK
jgi:hypothetical protein